MARTMTATIEERVDDETREHLRESARVPAQATQEPPRGRGLKLLERAAERWSSRTLGTLGKIAANRGNVAQSLRALPQRMHIIANQTELVLELIDDFKSGVYRQIPWRHVAVLAAVTLYAVSPADVLPDFLPFVGGLDDLALIALATRIARKQLRAYCEFKGYSVEKYFGPEG